MVIGWLSVVYILVFVIFLAVGVFRGLDSHPPVNGDGPAVI
jgi:hypothetical protein